MYIFQSVLWHIDYRKLSFSSVRVDRVKHWKIPRQQTKVRVDPLVVRQFHILPKETCFHDFMDKAGFQVQKYKNMQLKSLQLFRLNENLNEKMHSQGFDDDAL